MSKNLKVTYPVILTQNFLTVIADKEYSVTRTDARYASAIELYKKKDFVALLNLLDRPGAVERYTHGLVKVYDGVVTYNGAEVHGVITDRILRFVKEGIPFEPLVKFLNHLYENVSEGVRQKLYGFLENNNLAITDEGKIVAFKLVALDGSPPMHAGFFYETRNGKSVKVSKYRVGYEYTYPRDEIKEGTSECGTVGLYLANKNYWGGKFDADMNYTASGTGRLLIAEVDPKDVCNVAHSESSKMVVCRMRLVGEYKTLKNEVLKLVVKRSAFGLKPNGDKFHNLRDAKGHFVKRSGS